MNNKQLESLFEETIMKTKDILIKKGDEYANSEDRLGNFKRGAAHNGITPLQVMSVYMSKHYDAIGTYIKDDAQKINRERSESIEGRFYDLINYCILGLALIKE